MNKVNLTPISKVRIAEMVSVHLDPAERFSVNDKGEVSLNAKNKFILLVTGNENLRYDFMEVTQAIIDKIMSAKGEIPYVKQLCGEALGELVGTNDREVVVKKLYLAHLVDEQPRNEGGRRDKQPIGQEITIRSEERVVPNRLGNSMTFRKVPSNFELSMDVADLMNRYGNVIVLD